VCNARAKTPPAASSGQVTGRPVLPHLIPVPEPEGWKQVTEHGKDVAQALLGQHWRPLEGAEGAQSPAYAPLPHLGTEIPPAMDPGCERRSVGREAGPQPARQ